MKSRLRLLFLIAIVLVLPGCVTTFPTCSLEQMLIPSDDIPDEVEIRTESPAPDGTEASILRTYYISSGTMSIELNLHSVMFQARNDYEYLINTRLNPDNLNSTWVKPTDLQYLRLSANEYSYGCHIDNPQICFLIARYGGITLRFSSHVSEDHSITLDEFGKLIENLDGRVSNCLSN